MAVTRAESKHVDEPSSTLSALPFNNADLETKPRKSQKSCSERRQDEFKNTVANPPVEVVPDTPLGLKIPANIIKMQKIDPG